MSGMVCQAAKSGRVPNPDATRRGFASENTKAKKIVSVWTLVPSSLCVVF